jgi:hypothetical protein
MKHLIMFIVYLVCLLPGVIASVEEDGQGLQAVPDALEDLRHRFSTVYPCPTANGLATFSAVVSSPLLTSSAQGLGLKPVTLGLRYDGPDRVMIEMAVPPLVGSSAARLLRDVGDSVRHAVEGFFEAYEPLAFPNLLTRVPASWSLEMGDSGLRIEYREGGEHRFVRLEFDRQFRLTEMSSWDEEEEVHHTMRPTWERVNDYFILQAIDGIFRQPGQPPFQVRFLIEHAPFGGFHLPSRVRIFTGSEGQAVSALEFSLNHYVVGLHDLDRE